MNKWLINAIALIMFSCSNMSDNAGDVNSLPSEEKQSGLNQQYRHRHRHRHGANSQGEKFAENIYFSGDTVFVPSNSPVRSRLSLQKVTCAEFPGEYVANGIVRTLPGQLAEVTSPFEGRISRSLVSLGQKVSAGTPLFEVISSDYLESVRTYIQAKHEKDLAEKNFNRKKDLFESGVGSRKDFDEAKLEFDNSLKEMEKSAAIMRIYNLNPDEVDLTRPLIIRSPITGEVVRTDITSGQYIKSDSESILTIAGLDKVQIIAHVREKALIAVSNNDYVAVCNESHPDKPVKGIVRYVGNMMNEQSRTVEVYVECDNSDRSLKPGMFVSVRFFRSLPDAIIVPASSVFQEDDISVLYVQTGENIFVRKRVTVTSANDNRLIVTAGVENGNTIVSEGGIYLR